ncbi:MAG: class I SAM-dependent methyltransferase [Gemmatimonadales bacterium]
MALRSRLEKLYWTVEQRIVPGLRSSQDAYHSALDRHVSTGTRWLDLGCGNALLPAWKQDSAQKLSSRPALLVGLDRSLTALKGHATISRRVCGDIAELPFPDQSFDLVTANMVAEHLNDPLSQFQEVRRVLVPGGIFLCHTPNVLGYPTLLARLVPQFLKRLLIRGLDGREPIDVFQTYYRANSPRRLRQLAAESALRTVEVRMTLSSAALVVVPPLAVLELLWIRALRWQPLQRLRPTMIATFRAV